MVVSEPIDADAGGAVIRRTVSPVADDARTPDTPSGWWRQLPAVAARISQGGVLPRLLAELTTGQGLPDLRGCGPSVPALVSR